MDKTELLLIACAGPGEYGSICKQELVSPAVFVSFVGCVCDKVTKSLDCPTNGRLTDAGEKIFQVLQSEVVSWSYADINRGLLCLLTLRLEYGTN